MVGAAYAAPWPLGAVRRGGAARSGGFHAVASGRGALATARSTASDATWVKRLRRGGDRVLGVPPGGPPDRYGFARRRQSGPRARGPACDTVATRATTHQGRCPFGHGPERQPRSAASGRGLRNRWPPAAPWARRAVRARQSGPRARGPPCDTVASEAASPRKPCSLGHGPERHPPVWRRDAASESGAAQGALRGTGPEVDVKAWPREAGPPRGTAAPDVVAPTAVLLRGRPREAALGRGLGANRPPGATSLQRWRGPGGAPLGAFTVRQAFTSRRQSVASGRRSSPRHRGPGRCRADGRTPLGAPPRGCPRARPRGVASGPAVLPGPHRFRGGAAREASR